MKNILIYIFGVSAIMAIEKPDYKVIHKKGTAGQNPSETYNGKATINFAEIILIDFIKAFFKIIFPANSLSKF